MFVVVVAVLFADVGIVCVCACVYCSVVTNTGNTTDDFVMTVHDSHCSPASTLAGV